MCMSRFDCKRQRVLIRLKVRLSHFYFDNRNKCTCSRLEGPKRPWVQCYDGNAAVRFQGYLHFTGRKLGNLKHVIGYRMAGQRTMQLCRRNFRLLLYSQHVTRCSRNILKRLSQWNVVPGFRHYSTSHEDSYKTMMGQDLEEEPAINSLPDYGLALDSWCFNVGNSGKLRLSSQMPVHIEALDAQRFTDMNKVFLNMLFLGKEELSGQQKIDMRKKYIVNADLDEGSVDLDLNFQYKQDLKDKPEIQCHLQVPLKYGGKEVVIFTDIDVSCEGKADASLKMLESENITVQTEHGDCFMNNLKSCRVSVNTQSGDIKCKSLVQGNITMETGSEGCIETGRLQGQTVECQTEKGHIKVKAVYGETCKVKTSSGRVLLTNCHGTTEIQSNKGDVTIGTMDGDLDANIKHGDVNVYFAREGNHHISSESGNVLVKLPSLNSNIELTGKHIDEGDVTIYRKKQSVDNSVKTIKGSLTQEGDNLSSMTVTTSKGRIELASHSWLSSLNLKNGNKS